MGHVIWEPSEPTAIDDFIAWLGDRGVGVADYDELLAWSIADLETFWMLVTEYTGVRWRSRPSRAVANGDLSMPGTRWFPGGTLNYAEHALRGSGGVIGRSQTRDRVELDADELRRQVAACRTGLQRLGVGLGDTVAAYLPNIPETIVAYLATVSLGAIWSSAAPEFGPQAVIDRFGQVEPKVLFTVDGWTREQYLEWSKRRATEGRWLVIPTSWQGLPCLRICVVHPSTDPAALMDILDDLATYRG